MPSVPSVSSVAAKQLLIINHLQCKMNPFLKNFSKIISNFSSFTAPLFNIIAIFVASKPKKRLQAVPFEAMTLHIKRRYVALFLDFETTTLDLPAKTLQK